MLSDQALTAIPGAQAVQAGALVFEQQILVSKVFDALPIASALAAEVFLKVPSAYLVELFHTVEGGLIILPRLKVSGFAEISALGHVPQLMFLKIGNGGVD